MGSVAILGGTINDAGVVFTAGQIAANSVEADAQNEIDLNYYDDSQCAASHNTTHCENEASCNVGYGCTSRKKTITFNGDVTYSNRVVKNENGAAEEVT